MLRIACLTVATIIATSMLTFTPASAQSPVVVDGVENESSSADSPNEGVLFFNSTGIITSGASQPVSPAPTSNQVFQAGERNVSHQYLSGPGNSVYGAQIGSSNTSAANAIGGRNNSVGVLQYGSGHTSSVNIIGSRNSAVGHIQTGKDKKGSVSVIGGRGVKVLIIR